MNKDIIEYLAGAAIALIVVAIAFVILLIFSGCSAAPRAVIKDRIITITPAAIHDTITIAKTDSAKMDSVMEAYKITEKGDTTIRIKVYPKKKQAVIEAKFPSQDIPVKDTIQVPKLAIKTVEIEKPYPILSKIGWLTIGVIIGVTGLIIIKWKM
jgi:hypothetical protein